MSEHSRTRVKICGITNQEDALSALQAGADAIGLVFYLKSSRYVDLSTAKDIAQAVGPMVTIVALFVNASADEVNRVLRALPIQLIQFHGDESNAFCKQFERPFMKAVRMAPGVDLEAEYNNFPDAQAILLDAFQPGVPGGTGKSFEWHRFPAQPTKPTVLAGGLNPSNVAEAIKQTKPYAVDVSGGVEQSPGLKCAAKINAFISACQH